MASTTSQHPNWSATHRSRENGRVTVRVSDQPTPAVSVSDDGPTIPESERERIFERFHRLPGAGDGSGLGLAIAREIARLHQARIGDPAMHAHLHLVEQHEGEQKGADCRAGGDLAEYGPR